MLCSLTWSPDFPVLSSCLCTLKTRDSRSRSPLSTCSTPSAGGFTWSFFTWSSQWSHGDVSSCLIFLAENCIFLPLVLFRRWRGHSSKRDFLPNAWPALCFSKDWSDPPSEFFSSVCVILSLGLLFHSVQNFSFTLTILTWESPSPVLRIHYSNRSHLRHLRKRVHLWPRMIREN